MFKIIVIIYLMLMAKARLPEKKSVDKDSGSSQDSGCSCKISFDPNCKLVADPRNDRFHCHRYRYDRIYKCHCAGPNDTLENFNGLVKNCFTKCSKYGYNYEWCYTNWNGDWDYCDSVKDKKITPCICEQPTYFSKSGKICLITCAQYGHATVKEWCYIDDAGTSDTCSSRDYCGGPTIKSSLCSASKGSGKQKLTNNNNSTEPVTTETVTTPWN